MANPWDADPIAGGNALPWANDPIAGGDIPGSMQGPPDERSFLQRAGSKLGSFFQNVYENPPPSVAAIRDIVQNAPQAATELTYGADPQAAEQAAGTMLGAASLGVTGPRALQFPREPIAAPAAAPSVVAPVIEAAARQGVDVPRYLATESRAIPMVAAGLEKTPFAGGPLERSATGMLEQLGEARGRASAGTATAETAGEAARAGVADWMKTGAQEPVGRAYKGIDELINPDVRLPLNNTADIVAQIMAERAQARLPGQSKAVQSVLNAVQDPTGMNYAGTKLLRTSLGERTPQELVAQGISPIEHKRIYGALSKDLGDVVSAAGGPEALTAWQQANALARLSNIQRQALNKVVGAKGDAAPEQVFNRLANFAGSKSTADINRLVLAKRAMGPDAWNEVATAMINRLGSAATDAPFSADRFVTAYRNISPRAKAELFTPAQQAALDDMMTVSTHIQQRVTRYANPSGTARNLNTVLGGLSLFHEPITAISSMLGGRLVAQALSRPAVARAATQVVRAQASGNRAAAMRAQQLLYQIAGREGLIQASPEYRRRLQLTVRPSGANLQNPPPE